MKRRFDVWLQAALLLVALISAEAQNTPEYFGDGGKLVLRPKSVSNPITSISWKFNDGIVGEWNKETLPLEFSPPFQGHAKVDVTTGVLELSNMMKNYSGVYTVEINDRIQSGGYDVKDIEQVPQPVAIMRPLICSPSSENCSLSCDGEVKEAGPVTFYFKKGDGDWEEGTQNIDIRNNETTRTIETFSCRMKNPLGQKDSEPVKNPFHVGSNAGKIVGIVFGVLAVIGLAVGGVVGGWYYYKQQQNGNRTDSTRAPSSNNANHPEETPLNGRSPDSKEDV